MIVHLHIPKNGGSTFDGILKQHFGAGFVPLYGVGEAGYFLAEAELRDFFSRNRQAQAVASHEIRYPCPDLPGLRYDYVTFLRHPVERIVSLYYYERKVYTAADPQHRANLPLEDYLALLIEQNALANWQCCHLHASCGLSQAQDVLRQCAVVGEVQLYDASLALAARKLNLPLRAMISAPRNVSKGFTARQRLDAALFERVARASGADMDLFHFGRDLLRAELRRQGRFFSFCAGWLRYANWSKRRPRAADYLRGKWRGLGRRARRLAGRLPSAGA